jgi:hypothetical protein
MSDNLGVYLNDHYAGATFGADLARRLRDENEGTRFADFLTRLAAEVEEDRETLKSIMERLDVSTDPIKEVMGWATEKASRLKIHGRSELSRILELESLLGGVEGKLGLWRALLIAAPSEPDLDAAQLEELKARAEGQIDGLRQHQTLAAQEVFAPDAVEGGA